MNVTSRMIRFAAAGLLFALGACGGGGDEGGGTPPPLPPPQTGIGPAGGTVLGPNGAKVEIPPGALATNVEIKVELSSAGAPPLPAGFTAIGQMYAFTPHGTTFAVPVTITLPFDPGSVPAGTTPELYKTNAQNQWEQVANATFNIDSVTAQVTSFSNGQVVIPPLVETKIGRNWSFAEYRNGVLANIKIVDSKVEIGGSLQEDHAFGDAFFDAPFVHIDGTTIPRNGIANGFIGSSEDGKTFYVGTEAPLDHEFVFNDPFASQAKLIQVQTFIKRADDASLTFTMPRALIDAHDKNAILGRECPPTHLCPRILGQLSFELETFNTEPTLDLIFHIKGGASLFGFAEHWVRQVSNDSASQTPLWALDDFAFVIEDLDGANDSRAFMNLRIPRTYTVDLSSIEVGRAFHVRITASAFTFNTIGTPPSEFETSVGAYMNVDPRITTLGFTGLEPIDTPLPLPEPVVLPVPPAACVPGPGPNPAAGVLQFSAASYLQLESSSVPTTITVTRTGGSSGAVTANFTTSDGTAIGGTDYTPVNATVFFADGDAEPRVVDVPIIHDLIDEPDRTVNLTLSQPGGCAALGTQTTAVLTIEDDDVTPLPSGLDPTFGSEGKATSTAFGGDRSAMALQADGKIVMVGGTFTNFILARFKADGTLDGDFGSGGKVTTSMVSGEQQEALGVAIQPDGKIVVVGHTGQAVGPTVFALARYKEDGSLDETFGVGGKVISTVPGRAFAVAIQTDGPDVKIVVAGDDLVAEDFALARFDANGNLDASFGNGGRINTDFDLGSELAGNIVLQTNGAILISGPHTNAGEVARNLHTALARYDADGNPDDSFGVEGKLTLSGQRVGEGLALQSDGKIVLVGNTGDGVDTSFAAARLEADGSPDNTFGDAGTVSTSISGLGDAALAVAIQSDDKIVVAGRSSSQVNSNFAVARYSPDGALDTDFVNGGPLTIDFFGFTDIAESVAVQSDGKIVLGGLARDNVDGYGVARVVP